MKATMRVLHRNEDTGWERIIPCYAAHKVDNETGEKEGSPSVFLALDDCQSEVIKEGEVMVLGDDGKSVHRWTL